MKGRVIDNPDPAQEIEALPRPARVGRVMRRRMDLLTTPHRIADPQIHPLTDQMKVVNLHLEAA